MLDAPQRGCDRASNETRRSAMASQVRDVMTQQVTTVTPEAPLQQVAQGDQLLGMVTDRDIVIRALADGGQGLERRTAGEVMTPDVQCCYADQNVGDVLKEMGDQQIRRLPVVDKERRLVGIVSLGDLSREAKPKQSGQALENISQPGAAH
jgi:CBS domain-containing protein